jgi:hypothetical protein
MSTKQSSTKSELATHYAISKLMNSLKELSKIEYSHENYGECVKRSIQWLKLYTVMLPKYSEFISEKEMIHANIEQYKSVLKSKGNRDYDRFEFILDVLSTDNYDFVLQKYMDCNKFLVGPIVYQLVQKVNSYLETTQQWDVFMTFNDMVELDNGHHQSEIRDFKLRKCLKSLNSVKKCNMEELTSFQNIISKIHFRVNHVEKSSEKVVDIEQKQEAEKCVDYDVVNCSNLDDYKDWTDITTPSWAYITPKDWDIKCRPVNKSGMRLTLENAEIGQTISYQTKKSVEYGKITSIKPTYVEITRLAKKADGSFVLHEKPVCKASGNKPAFTRVITIV